MKNLLILHGSYGSPDKNWYQYLGKNSQNKGYQVNIPQLPNTDKPNLDETYKFLYDKNLINNETVMVGHSSGATLVLGILQKLPYQLKITKAILVAGLVDAKLTRKLFQVVPKTHYDKLFPVSWDWQKIKNSCDEFIIVHAPNDPYVQLRHAKIIQKQTQGKLVIIQNGSHFSISTGGEKFKKFPELVKMILE